MKRDYFMTNIDRVLEELTKSKERLCDDCLSFKLHVYPRQQVNQICNREFNSGNIKRLKSVCSLCGNTKFVNFM